MIKQLISTQARFSIEYGCTSSNRMPTLCIINTFLFELFFADAGCDSWDTSDEVSIYKWVIGVKLCFPSFAL